MSQHDIDPIETLRAELSRVEVSPEFAARVRRQIEAAPARSWWFSMFDWHWAVPVAAAAVIGAFVLTRSAGPTPAGVDPAGVQARVPEANVPQGPQAPSMTATVQESPRPSQTTRVRVPQRTVSLAAASGQQAEDKLEVITYQPAVYRQLWAAAAAAAQVVHVADLPVDVRDVVITPVEVGPVVVQWLVEPPVSSGGSIPIIRRVSADAERSDK